MPNNQLEVPTFSSKQFTWDNMNKVGIAEDSSLGHVRPMRLYSDSADIGIAIRSAKTGEVGRWYYFGVKNDQEGELVYWIYRPTIETARQFPHLANTLLHILND